jgi:hypothetical protein
MKLVLICLSELKQVVLETDRILLDVKVRLFGNRWVDLKEELIVDEILQRLVIVVLEEHLINEGEAECLLS